MRNQMIFFKIEQDNCFIIQTFFASKCPKSLLKISKAFQYVVSVTNSEYTSKYGKLYNHILYNNYWFML